MMAGTEPRVHYLAGFSCPFGGLAAGKPRVLCHDAEVFLSTGSEFVYVYDQEGGLLTVSAGSRAGGGRRGGRGRGFSAVRPGAEKATGLTRLSWRPGGVPVPRPGVAPAAPGPSQSALRSVCPEGHLLPGIGASDKVRDERASRVPSPPRMPCPPWGRHGLRGVDFFAQPL